MPAGLLLTGDNNDNIFVGGAGNDTILAFGGSDAIQGQEGDDSINAGSGHDAVYAQEGDDTVLAASGDDMIWGGTGRDYLSGYDGNDTLIGEQDDDSLRGGLGNDYMEGNEGNDKLEGGDGNDSLLGGMGDDRLFGEDGNDLLVGEDGNDKLFASNGNDALYSGLGRDTLTGGEGADRFTYETRADSTATSLDIITDFQVGIDKIDLRGLGYSGITAGADNEGELRLAYSAASDRTYVRDDFSDFEIALKGDLRSTLTNADFFFNVNNEGVDNIGYYELSADSGGENAAYAAPIVANGLNAISLETLSVNTLQEVDAVFLLNQSNEYYSSEFLAALPALHDFVFTGGTLVLHDRYVEGAEIILPGLGDVDIMRNFDDAADIDFVHDAGLIASGVGVLDDTSLDGGSYSNHGFVIDGELEAAIARIHTGSNPENIVSFAYEYGEGTVYYSTIPLDHYLNGYGDDALDQHMQTYAENVVNWVAQGGDVALV